MRLRAGSSSSPRTGMMQAHIADPFENFLNPTMAAGTRLVTSTFGLMAGLSEEPCEYVQVRIDVILEYERSILELRRELYHYKAIMSEFWPRPGAAEEFPQAEPVIPIDAASVRILNSVLTARVPPSATFVDFEEGEL